jgi:acyl-CoA thioesterase I
VSGAPVVLFVGDSVTDEGRREDPDGLGGGYVRLLAEGALAGATVLNRGIAGDRVRDVRARWATDVVAARPDIVTVLVGVNDTWRRFDSDDPTPADRFARDYAELLSQTPGAAVILMEPFVLPVRAEQRAWREDLEEKIAAVHRLAGQHGARLVRLDAELNAAARDADAAAVLAYDGVHPTDRGHAAIADLWLRTARPLLAEVAAH